MVGKRKVKSVIKKNGKVVNAIKKEQVAIVKAIKETDKTIERFNFNKKDLIVTFKKSISLNSFSYNNLAGFGINFLFDPSNSVTGSSFGKMNDWDNIKTLFTEYKIKKCRLLFTYQSSATTPEKEPYVMVHNQAMDYTNTTPTAAVMMQYINVIKKTFTDESPTWEYSVVPRIAAPIFQGTGILGTTSYVMEKARYIDINDPVLHYGIGALFSTLSATQTIIVDVEYTIDFKNAY